MLLWLLMMKYLLIKGPDKGVTWSAVKSSFYSILLYLINPLTGAVWGGFCQADVWVEPRAPECWAVHTDRSKHRLRRWHKITGKGISLTSSEHQSPQSLFPPTLFSFQTLVPHLDRFYWFLSGLFLLQRFKCQQKPHIKLIEVHWKSSPVVSNTCKHKASEEQQNVCFPFLTHFWTWTRK